MSDRVFNFSPGPAALPDAVMARARDEFMALPGAGASVMEISHRGARFLEVYRRAEALARELAGIPDDYDVLFLPGGAGGMTAAVPMNLLPEGGRAAHAVTGHWSRLAADEGKKFGEVVVVADGGPDFRRIPPESEWARADGAAYLHYADNETIHGLEFASPPDFAAPLVADMTSNILSRPVRVSDFGLIYASAQKNLGPSGATLVVVRRELVRPPFGDAEGVGLSRAGAAGEHGEHAADISDSDDGVGAGVVEVGGRRRGDGAPRGPALVGAVRGAGRERLLPDAGRAGGSFADEHSVFSCGRKVDGRFFVGGGVAGDGRLAGACRDGRLPRVVVQRDSGRGGVGPDFALARF